MRVKAGVLKDFAVKVMKAVGCDEKRADIVAEVLVEADMRGISSHGVARLKRYVDHIRAGLIDPRAEPVVVFETPVSIVVDGCNGVGQYISNLSMRKTVEKAKNSGICITVVRNSNHYGIAGYYAEMASKEGMIGISLTNTAPLVVPTFSKEALLGTNPIAFAFPMSKGRTLLVDMATSVVPRGKLEVRARLGKTIPEGWAVDETGRVTRDPHRVLLNVREKRGGGLLPLGGEGETFGGHKGYGLGVIVEILTAGLSLGSFSYETYTNAGRISHLFAAVDISLFGDPKEIEEHVHELVKRLKSAEKAEGAERIYIHGEKEYERREESLKVGVEIDEPTVESLRKLADEIGIEVPF